MKRFLVLLLTLLLVLSAFGAASAEEPVTVTFAFWGDGFEKEAVEATLQAFEEASGVNVELMYTPDDYATKMVAMAASNTLPDCGYCPEANVIEWAMNGMIYNLNDMFTAYGLGVEDRMGQVFVGPTGDIYGTSVGGGAGVLFYNPDKFDELGVEYPSASEPMQWEDMIALAKQMTVDENGLHPDDEGFNPDAIVTYGINLDLDNTMFLDSYFRSNGGGLVSEDGSTCLLNTPETLEVIQALQDMIYVHHISPAPGSSADNMDMSSAFLSGTMAMIAGGTWSFNALAAAAKEDGIRYEVAPLPYFDEPVTLGIGTPIVIFKDTQHYDECLQLVEFFSNPENTIDLIHSGLWMTTLRDWFEDDDIINNQWLVEGVHPESYVEGAIKYLDKYLQPMVYYTMAYTDQIDDLYLGALDTVWLGTATPEEAVDSIYDEVQAICDRWTEEKAAVASEAA